jgi:hypothetical protein
MAFIFIVSFTILAVSAIVAIVVLDIKGLTYTDMDE